MILHFGGHLTVSAVRQQCLSLPKLGSGGSLCVRPSLLTPASGKTTWLYHMPCCGKIAQFMASIGCTPTAPKVLFGRDLQWCPTPRLGRIQPTGGTQTGLLRQTYLDIDIYPQNISGRLGKLM